MTYDLPEQGSKKTEIQQNIQEIERKPGTHKHHHHGHQQIGRFLKTKTIRSDFLNI